MAQKLMFMDKLQALVKELKKSIKELFSKPKKD